MQKSSYLRRLKFSGICSGICGKSGTPRQQFEHMGVTICHLCASERAGELQAEGE